MLAFYIPHRKEGETLVMLLRRHPFVIVTKLAFWVVVAVAPVVFYFLAKDATPFVFNNSVVYPIVVLFTSVYYLYLWLFAFHSFVDYYLDVWIVTNYRIINIEQRGLFSRTVSEQELDRIQDVTSELKGFFSTMLDFGTVYIQTAGEQVRFVFKQIPDPYGVSRKITKLAEQRRQAHQETEQKIPTQPPAQS